MPIYDRPHFGSHRERERGFRERELPSGRRGYGRWQEDDDDRGPWISRDRDYRGREANEREREWREPMEPDFDPRENQFGRDRRFEQFEEWERPLQMREFQMREFSAHPSSGRRFGAYGRGTYGPGGFEHEGRYAGRGPKGYQRSDERIREEVCERLTAAPDIDAVDVEVLAQNAEVTLEGTIRERAMKRAVEDCAEAVPGVRQVHNRLRVEAGDRDEAGGASGPFGSRSDEGQRSSTGRKAH